MSKELIMKTHKNHSAAYQNYLRSFFITKPPCAVKWKLNDQFAIKHFTALLKRSSKKVLHNRSDAYRLNINFKSVSNKPEPAEKNTKKKLFPEHKRICKPIKKIMIFCVESEP